MSKKIKSILTLVILSIIAIAAFLYFQSTRQQEEFGGFQEGTEQYYGYRYAQDNLKSVDQCDDDKDDPSMNFNEEFFQGCLKYFEHK
ncbi:hypothetical protein B9T26_06720 [Acinetobacter sp. ANC 4169]|uniref:hypothetical protein n=1 Tax=Acinetobacter sp. ANC 4169 TaxID=1977879 RepID=UPI000A35783A|nr:hypothetical protein [Acinetobacter sp. ANC 4169]OTG74651.1 hypothetical protein B9T26_06720 [Acinetobacter sp. ANC 4169]